MLHKATLLCGCGCLPYDAWYDEGHTAIQRVWDRRWCRNRWLQRQNPDIQRSNSMNWPYHRTSWYLLSDINDSSSWETKVLQPIEMGLPEIICNWQSLLGRQSFTNETNTCYNTVRMVTKNKQTNVMWIPAMSSRILLVRHAASKRHNQLHRWASLKSHILLYAGRGLFVSPSVIVPYSNNRRFNSLKNNSDLTMMGRTCEKESRTTNWKDYS